MQPLPPEDWDSSLQPIIEAMNGRPIQIHCLLANHPALLQAWWSYRMHSVRGGDLAQREARADQRAVAVGAGHGADGGERVGRVERDLDAVDAGLDEGGGDGDGFLRDDAAEDGDQGAAHAVALA